MNEQVTIPARKGKAAFVENARSIKLINTHGYQIVDTWAFNKHDLREHLSMEHCRVAINSLRPKVGDTFVTNNRRPIITLVEDTSPGIHDMVIASCDRYRYASLGCKEYHDSCTDNLVSALKELGLTTPEIPCPFNIFQNTPYDSNTGVIRWLPAAAKPGDYVTLRAEMDIVIVFSSCPMDIVKLNGPAGDDPREAHFQLL
jgi:uncharacterized protein YcgI (DUF1989 family)